MNRIGRREFITGAAAAGLTVVQAGTARAQGGGEAWPNRSLRFVVPLAPGGGIDFVARAIGEYISRPLGQQVVVENRTGAGGTIGMDTAMKKSARWLHDPDHQRQRGERAAHHEARP